MSGELPRALIAAIVGRAHVIAALDPEARIFVERVGAAGLRIDVDARSRHSTLDGDLLCALVAGAASEHIALYGAPPHSWAEAVAAAAHSDADFAAIEEAGFTTAECDAGIRHLAGRLMGALHGTPLDDVAAAWGDVLRVPGARIEVALSEARVTH